MARRTTKKTAPKKQWDTGIRINPETGEKAPKGQMWAKTIFGHWFLENIGAMYTASPASETYWSS